MLNNKMVLIVIVAVLQGGIGIAEARDYSEPTLEIFVANFSCTIDTESGEQAATEEPLNSNTSEEDLENIECKEIPQNKDARQLKLNSSSTDDEHSPATELEIGQQSPSTGSPSLRRKPIGEEEEFQPKRLPLRVPDINRTIQPRRASPGVTIINPSGFGAAWGNAGIGFGFQERTRFTDDNDGAIGIGFGLGNPRKNVGLQIGLALTDLSDLFADGSLSLKLHRQLPQGFNIAIGAFGVETFGETDGGSSLYGVVTKRFALKKTPLEPFSEIYTSIGIGGGQFRSESDIDNGVDSVGVFSSVAVRIIEPMTFITEWTGQDLTVGVSYAPFRNIPLVIVPAITDITGSAGDGTRFIFGFGYSFSF